MTDRNKILVTLIDEGRRRYSPDVFLTDGVDGGYALTEDQAFDIADQAKQLFITSHMLKIDCENRLENGQIIKDLYGTFGKCKPPTNTEVIAKLWVIIPLIADSKLDKTKTAQALMESEEKLVVEGLNRGWGRPYILRSGNISYVLYKCKLQCDDKNNKLYDRITSILGKIAETSSVRFLKSDQLGTLPLDGELRIPKQPVNITPEMIHGFLDDLHFEKIKADGWNSYKPDEFDVGKWLNDRGIPHDMVLADSTDIYKVTDSETIYFDRSNHSIGFLDITDTTRTWEDFRCKNDGGMEALEKEAARERMWQEFNRNKPPKGHLRKLVEDVDYSDPRTFTLKGKDLRKLDRAPKQYLKTGIKLLDESPDGRHHGIPRAGVTLLMARTSAGKTALMTEIKAYMTLKMNYKVWEFNAELSSKDVRDYLEKNAAGKDKLVRTGLGVYEVTDDDADKLWEELDKYYELYDHNRIGFEWEHIENSIIWSCMNGFDCVILDDQIMIDLGIFNTKNDGTGESEACALMRRLNLISQHYNVAVIMICHPRKEQETRIGNNRLVMAEDILGSVKIPSLATMILLLHRVYKMDDFKLKALNTSGIFLEEDDPILTSNCDSVIQIAKDRFGGGSQSYLIPTYFEPGTNRFKNSRTEHRIYPVFAPEVPLHKLTQNPFA